jgi:hypothetical protein
MRAGAKPAPGRPACLATAASVTTIGGRQASQYRDRAATTGTGYDARTASWVAVGNWPVHIARGSDVCWVGGRIQGTFSDRTTWNKLHGTGAFSLGTPGSTVDGIRIHNYGDGIRVVSSRSEGFTIREVHLSFLRDDCVENDRLHGGVLEDSLLDGCYVALSARPSKADTASEGRTNTWVVRRSLIRLQPMPTVYKGPAPGHGGFFKWDQTGRGPRLTLEDNVFRVDQRSNHTTMGVPPGALAGCRNNTMVWLGDGPYPDPLPDCFTVTTDPAVWDDAVAAWQARHPGTG